MNAMTFRDAYNANKFKGLDIDLGMYSLLLSKPAEESLCEFDGWQFENLDVSRPEMPVYFKGDVVVRFLTEDKLIGIGQHIETVLPKTLEEFIVVYRLAQRSDDSLPDLEWHRSAIASFLPLEKAA